MPNYDTTDDYKCEPVYMWAQSLEQFGVFRPFPNNPCLPSSLSAAIKSRTGFYLFSLAAFKQTASLWQKIGQIAKYQTRAALVS